MVHGSLIIGLFIACSSMNFQAIFPDWRKERKSPSVLHRWAKIKAAVDHLRGDCETSVPTFSPSKPSSKA